MAEWSVYHGQYRLDLKTDADGSISVDAYLKPDPRAVDQSWRPITGFKLRHPKELDGKD